MKVLCALALTLAVSVSASPYVLAAESAAALVLFLLRRPSLPNIMKLNALNLVMIVTFALTWPDFRGGITAGIITALRVNIIYVVFAGLGVGLGDVCGLPLPEKLRVLIILTARGIFIMRDSLDASLRSAKLRAPDAGLMARVKIFAYVMGNVLVRSSVRGERMAKAIKTRGGFGGFAQNG